MRAARLAATLAPMSERSGGDHMQYETNTDGTALRAGGVAMREAWERLIVGPLDAERSVLLLPGGANAARSFDLVMAEPALAGVRLVATTLPGMAGAPLVGDVSVPGLARRAGELAELHSCDVVVGFSHGATVALEMLLGGHFRGPVVLLGISLTTADEAAFFRGMVSASQRVGSWPMAILIGRASCRERV